MATVNIEDVFDNDRLPSGVYLLPLLLYFPLGLCLALVRVFIGLHTWLIACILPKHTSARSYILRVMCSVLGILVSVEDSSQRDPRAKVMVANYTSVLDHLAVQLVLPHILPSVWDLPTKLMWLLGYTDMGVKQGRDVLIQNAKKHCSESSVPLLAFPEGASTNGKVGLLKFSVWPFSLEQPVRPILIKVSRPPIARISPSVLGGRWWLDVFWFLFVPYTHFHVRVLASMRKGEEEEVEDFTRRVQTVMASGLGLRLTPYTSADKVEYAKRKLHVVPHTGSDSVSQDPVIDNMTRQVKDVLPHVPVADIMADLALTKDVDLTITNFVEGHVDYTPEDMTESSAASSPSLSPVSSSDFTTHTVTFSKSSKERHLSLDERKKALMDFARRQYIQKHGLTG